jgi:hypothetical protein
MKAHISKIDEPILSLEELVERHLSQSRLKLVLETNLNTLQKDLLATDKEIFDIVKETKGERIKKDDFEVFIERTTKDIPGKTTYKYKEIVETIDANYMLDPKWLKRVYAKYSTVIKSQTKKVASLIIISKPINAEA